MLKKYLQDLQMTLNRGDAREESYYAHLKDLLLNFAEKQKLKKPDVTILPKNTEAGNPDFRVWDGENHIVGYIEAKAPSVKNLDYIEESEQLIRYCSTFPNVILTNFYEFRLYRYGELVSQVTVGRADIARKLETAPPVENEKSFYELLDRFFSFSLPSIRTSKVLSLELAKRTRFLRDEIITIELAEEQKKNHKAILGFYEAFKKYLIAALTEEQFADLYAQTITYGLFAARSRAEKDFNRKLAFTYIPNTIGILRDVFQFISLGDAPKPLQIIVDDISEVLKVTDVKNILQTYFREGKGKDPIIHFYETFLSAYDPAIRERRGVYYTPEPVVSYIVKSLHQLLKTHFNLSDGLANENVTILDPAAGTLTFPAEALKIAVAEFIQKYGEGGKHNFIKRQILPNFYAFELMMAPYAIGHLKMSFLFEELDYHLAEDERFNLYLTNTLEIEELEQINIPGLSSLSEESHLAGKVKKEQPILVIMGNPPYSGISANSNEWTERLLKDDIGGAQSYYKVDGEPLAEKNPKWLQDDYVKFLRFAQWKIDQAGFGIVGMITNHSYLDNPTFRGMRQSLTKTFNEIYILDLHGNSLKKETAPGGNKDENVFDIRQGVAIAIFIKQKNKKGCKVYHNDLYGLREDKYQWLVKNDFKKKNYSEIKPQSPWYFFFPMAIERFYDYLHWRSINQVFPLNGVGMTTARDSFVIDFDKKSLENRIRLFKNSKLQDDELHSFFQIKKKKGWDIRKAWNMLQSISDSELSDYIKPVMYRPFDTRWIFYHDSIVWRTVKKVMRHLLEGENIGITWTRPQSPQYEFSALISDSIIDQCVVGNKSSGAGISYIGPLYLYPEKEKSKSKAGSTMMMVFEPRAKYVSRRPNIDAKIYQQLKETYSKEPSPEEILYYIYGIFYSNTYRRKYAEFLKIDFPRVPFTANFEVFGKVAAYGKQLADLHLFKSKTLDHPISKYHGSGDNDRIEKIKYDENANCIYINNGKYFDDVTPELWNYQIGGYRVLHKYLKDRKGRMMEAPRLYSRIITAIGKTIVLQKQIDAVYSQVEKKTIEF
ncbi:MAG: N-6 DNA methylase [Actinobacteria bacterium]|nr:N-6 DNA methylase [Actinomycetota bacterium]